MTTIILILILSYLIGSVSPSIILSRWVKGVDIRTYGSGNAGMTNAIRLLGPKWGTVVALIDLAKGFSASMVIVFVMRPYIDFSVIDEMLLRILAGAAAVVGHIWTIFFRFRGGKGVLTMAGAILGVAPLEIGLCLVVFLTIFLTTRIVSLGSVIGAICFPIIVFVERWWFRPELSPYLLVFSLFASGLLIFTHRTNIRRLLRGEEHAFRTSAKSSPQEPAGQT